MKAITHHLSGTTLLTALLLTPSPARAETRHLALPSYRVPPGAVLEVPLTLDNAAGLAAVRVQINFDPEVLTLEAVTPGPLGAAFEMSQGEGDGFVRLTFARAAELADGAGRLVALKFRANTGATVDQVSELAIADLGLSDATGVIDLRQKDTLQTRSGEVIVSVLPNIDNAANGLPDWWELQHGLDTFAANTLEDPDDDGLCNLLEYAFGGDPRVPDAGVRGPQYGRFENDGQGFLRLGFHRRKNDPELTFQVQESPDLLQWNVLPLPQQLLGSPLDQGDGIEYVQVLGTRPMDGAGAQPSGFIRVVVKQTK